jgi:YbbR domain-containing protein
MIQLQWVERAQRTLPVEPTIEDQPASGLMLVGSPTARPAAVTISGPASEIAQLEHVTTEPISIGGLAVGRYERRVALVRPPPYAKYESEPFVTVSFEIAPQTVERSMSHLDIAVVGGVVRELRPSRVRVTLRGPLATLDAIDPQSVVPYVDVTTLSPAGGAQVVRVEVRGIPEGVELVDVEPRDVLATPAH